MTSRAKARPAEGPPTFPRSILTSSGSLIDAAWSTKTPITARFGSSGSAVVRQRDVSRSVPRRTVICTSSPGWWAPTRRSRSERVRTGLPSTATITSFGRSLPDRRRAGDERVDEHADALRLHVVAELAQRDGRRDLLRAGHRAQLALPARLFVDPGRAAAGPRARASSPRGSRGRRSRATTPCGRRRRRSRCRRRRASAAHLRSRRAVRPHGPGPAGSR